MRINNISINNFRCYYGENKINFNNEGKITLIYGDSGYGKSSFLQFFKWMFYDNPDFGSKDDKPLFNLTAFYEKNTNDSLEVSGKIEFEHLGAKYSLIKKLVYKVGLREKSTFVSDRDVRMSVLVNDNWEPYKGDISNKINSIMPMGLSSYFLLDGEKARDIVLDSKNLKKAIYSLFGIDAYDKAIKHLGSNHQKKSVIGYFNGLMTSQMKTTVNDMSAAEMQEALEDLYEHIEDLKEERKEIMSEIDMKNARRDEIFKILGEANNKGNLNQIIKQNNQFIAEYQGKIRMFKRKIGDLFYKNYPYLLLSSVTSKSSTILREKNSAIASNYKNVFENLKKDLLKEILQKNTCVCGRALDDNSVEHINCIINVMPPDSYTYQFGQFVSKSKRQLQQAKLNVIAYDDILGKISKCEQMISKYEDDNHEKEESLKRLDEAKTLVDELESIKTDIEDLNRRKAGLEGKIAQKKQIYDMSSKQLKDIQKNDKVSQEYGGKIKFFQIAHDTLVSEKNDMETNVKIVLNKCVRDVFKKLSTQKELDPDTIQFINDDFSLRTTYLSGGQLAVDEYSYVIGLIKALQECKMENNENPIIIDAPFAFTGNTQSEHIFKTLPSVAKQAILLTLDLNKIKKLLSDDSLYEFYVIKNESQAKARIERGNINDIKL
mgnify:CR=1 FL=1